MSKSHRLLMHTQIKLRPAWSVRQRAPKRLLQLVCFDDGLVLLVVVEPVHEGIEIRIVETGPLGDDVPGSRLDGIAFDANAVAVELGQTRLRRDIAAGCRPKHPAKAGLVFVRTAKPGDEPAAEIELRRVITLDRGLDEIFACLG